jgi:hypothetical protein
METVMAKTPKLLDEALAALRAVKRLKIDYDHDLDLPMHRAFQRVNRVLTAAAKKKAA